MSAEDAVTYDFDEQFQDKIAGIYARDTRFAKRVNDLISPDYFVDEGTSLLVRICKDHLERFSAVPDWPSLKKILTDMRVTKRLRDDQFDSLKNAVRRAYGVSINNEKYVADQVATFAKHQAIQNAMMTAIPMLEKGSFDEIRDVMQAATQVGLNDDFEDYDYFEKIDARTAKREDIALGRVVNDGITTGYPKIDVHLYHNGWGRRELSCLMGAAKAGKSLALGDFGKNAALKGYNVLYVSLEVSKEILSERIDASLSDTLMTELVKDRAKIETAIKTHAATTAAKFRVIDFPSGSLKVSGLERTLEQYRDRGIVFDLVIVDYADIMCPASGKDDLREGLRKIYIDLRALAHRWNIALLTATQTNRDGAKAMTAKATDVGDDWNKVRTVDVLIGINASEAEKAAGEARLFWAASRNTADGFSIRIRQDRERMTFLKDVIGVER